MIKDLTLKGCIEFAIATEELGASIYTQLAAKFGNSKDISELFSHLAADEKAHRQQLFALLKKAPEEEGAPRIFLPLVMR